MRVLVLASIAVGGALLAGCPIAGSGECRVDGDCTGGEQCSRDGVCMAASSLRDVKAVWTLRGMAASEATCAGALELYINFGGGPGESLGYSPVPCPIGQFVVTRLPKSYTRVELGVHNGGSGGSDTAGIDASGTATLDLTP